jgi:hypothetical protein
MARKSRIKSMRAVSGLLFLAVAGLVTAGAVGLRHDYFLTGIELIGWALVPLAVLLGFTLPVLCKVKTTSRKACGNWAYGLLFGCNKAAGHWTGKFLVRLGLKGDEARPVQRREPKGAQALMYQPSPKSKPVKVTVEESGLAKCGFWIGLVSGAVGIVEAVVTLVH